MKRWSDVIKEGKTMIETTVKRLDPKVECEADGGRSFYNDTLDLILQKQDKRAFVVVTFEAWTNAKTNPRELEQAFKKIVSSLVPKPQTVFLVSTQGLKETPLGKEWESLQEPDGWQKFEDEAALLEADKVAEEFFKK